jgi:hypothetical protein
MLARCKNIDTNDIKVDAFGDLRIVRHAIIHNKSVLSAGAHEKLKAMKDIFAPAAEITVTHDQMHRLFVLMKQGLAALILEHTGQRPGAPNATEIVDLAIQRKR